MIPVLLIYWLKLPSLFEHACEYVKMLLRSLMIRFFAALSRHTLGITGTLSGGQAHVRDARQARDNRHTLRIATNLTRPAAAQSKHKALSPN